MEWLRLCQVYIYPRTRTQIMNLSHILQINAINTLQILTFFWHMCGNRLNALRIWLACRIRTHVKHTHTRREMTSNISILNGPIVLMSRVQVCKCVAQCEQCELNVKIYRSFWVEKVWSLTQTQIDQMVTKHLSVRIYPPGEGRARWAEESAEQANRWAELCRALLSLDLVRPSSAQSTSFFYSFSRLFRSYEPPNVAESL